MKEFEKMQKLAFGHVIPALKNIKTTSVPLTENELKAKIKELVHSTLGEAKKKKKGDDVAPQEDVEFEMDTTEETPEDTIEPESTGGADIDPTVKSIQDSLQKAFAEAKALGDDKLIAQIGNTITMLVRTQVLDGQDSMNENEEGFESDETDYQEGYRHGYNNGYRDAENGEEKEKF
jgi:hypothetical protein